MTAPSALTRLRGTWRLLLKELGAFGVVGGLCFALDSALFQLLYTSAGLGAVPPSSISTVVSMTVAYLGNRYWSFSHRARTGCAASTCSSPWSTASPRR